MDSLFLTVYRRFSFYQFPENISSDILDQIWSLHINLFPHILKLGSKGRSQFAIHHFQIGGELTEIGFMRRMDFIMYIFINSSHNFSQINAQSENTSTSTITFFDIFMGPVGCLTLTMTQIPMAHKYDKLVKGATLSDVYSFAPLKLH